MQNTTRLGFLAQVLAVALGFILARETGRMIDKFKIDYDRSVQLNEQMLDAANIWAPRGTQPTGEIWFREEWLPWCIRNGMVRHPSFKIFKTDGEVLSILAPKVNATVYLRPMDNVVMFPGTLVGIAKDGTAVAVLPSQNCDQCGPIVQYMQDDALVLPTEEIGAIYVYEEKK